MYAAFSIYMYISVNIKLNIHLLESSGVVHILLLIPLLIIIIILILYTWEYISMY